MSYFDLCDLCRTYTCRQRSETPKVNLRMGKESWTDSRGVGDSRVI